MVYLLSRSKWNQEVRYSLRSFERHFPDLGNVWIVGYLPPYLDASVVRHVLEPPMPRPGVFVESVAKRFVNDELEDLSQDYVFACDDCYVLRPVTIRDFDPLWVQDLHQVASRGTGSWQLMLWRTFDLLVHMGHSGHNYESHTPSHVNRAEYAAVAALFRNTENAAHHRYDGICTTSAYWNIVGPPGERRWADQFRIGFTDGQRNHTVEMIERQLEGKTFMFHDDDGLSQALRTVIERRFPEKSKFEL